MVDEYSTYNASALREALVNADLPALRQSGLLDQQTLEVLERIKRAHTDRPQTTVCRHCEQETANEQWCSNCSKSKEVVVYEDVPSQARLTEDWERIVRRNLSKRLSKAVQNGRAEQIAHAVGLQQTGSALSGGFIEYEQIRSMLARRDSPTFIFAGSQGGGKSSFTFLMAILWYMIRQNEDENPLIITNGKTFSENASEIDYLREDEGEEIARFVSDMHDVINARVDHDGPIFFAGDEFSSYLTGYGRDLSDAADFGRLIRRFRKLRITAVFVGHRTTDISPNARDLESTVFIEKPAKEQATFYESVEDNGELVGEMLSLSGVPDCPVDFGTSDIVPWSWEGAERLNEMIQQGDKRLLQTENDEDDEDDEESDESCVSCGRVVGLCSHGYCGAEHRDACPVCGGEQDSIDSDPTPDANESGETEPEENYFRQLAESGLLNEADRRIAEAAARGYEEREE